MSSHIQTRILVISDTHGEQLHRLPTERVDIAIHSGDLTEESKLDEFRTSIQLLKALNAPLKLVIAGNHDFTLDTQMFKKKLEAIQPPLEATLVKREYGDFGEALELFNSQEAKDAGIVFLDEGNHRFKLGNGATLTVYASPYTASVSDWGFQYHPQEEHEWDIQPNVDIAITHGPPKGVLDYTDSRTRAGSPSLFAAIARAKPTLHCFGHIHEGWGAKLVSWRDEISKEPSHFTDVDNEQSVVLESLAGITARKFDDPDTVATKMEKRNTYSKQGYCAATGPASRGKQTLFLNASIEGPEEDRQQLPWMVDLDLSMTK